MKQLLSKSLFLSTAVKYHPLTDPKAGRKLFFMCFAAYLCTYLGRLNYSAALADIIINNVMERDTAGLISTAFFLMYGTGQLINGFMGDKMSPFFMVGNGIFLSGVMNVMMFFVTSNFDAPWLYIIIWGINGFAQSSIWSPLIRIVSSVLPECQRVKGCLYMFAAIASGTLTSYLLSSALLSTLGWQSVFIIPGCILVIASIGWKISTLGIVRNQEYRVPVLSKAEKKAAANANPSSVENAKLFPLVISSGVIFVVFMVMMMAMVKDGVTNWTPTFISDTFGTTAAFSVFLTTLLPIANLAASPVTKFVNENILHNELRSAAVFFGLGILAVTVLYFFGTMHIAVMVICLAVTSFSMLSINSLLISLVPMRFSVYGKVSTVTGILNSTAYLSSSLSSFIVGKVTKYYPMAVMVIIWLMMGCVGIILALSFADKWKHFVIKTEALKKEQEKAEIFDKNDHGHEGGSKLKKEKSDCGCKEKISPMFAKKKIKA
nr:MFS transporter [Clostridia bacterium]